MKITKVDHYEDSRRETMNNSNKAFNRSASLNLPFCTNAPHPEMARNADVEEPCDDCR